MSEGPSQPKVGSSWPSIELGPDLPPSVFASVERWHQDRIHAVAVYCSDGRWGEAFDDFCQKHLRIPRYDRLAVPGGPAWLAGAGENALFEAMARQHLDFLIQVHEIQQIVLITHFGCAHYGQRLQKSPSDCLQAQYEDVRNAKAKLCLLYPHIRVDTYLAMRKDNLLSFHGLDG